MGKIINFGIVLLLIVLMAVIVNSATISTCGTLSSAGQYDLTQNISASGTCITIGASNVNLDCHGYTVNFSSSAVAARLSGIDNPSGYDNITIRSCNINTFNGSGADDNYGVFFSGSVNSTIYNNTITVNGTDNNVGIWLTTMTSYNNITSNTISTDGSSNLNYGIIVITSSTNNLISQNTIKTNGSGSTNPGIYMSGFSINNTVTNNSISTYGKAAVSSFAYGIYLINNVNNSIIANNTIRTNANGSQNYGIYLIYNNNFNSIIGNDILTNGTGTSDGILLSENNTNNTIMGNFIRTGGSGGANTGIRLTFTGNNTVSNNTIRTNSSAGGANYGVWLQPGSLSNSIINNNISTWGTTNANRGVNLVSANDTLIANNTIKTDSATSFQNYGIYLDSSYSNIITQNNINTNGTNSNYGIWLFLDSNDNNITSNIIKTDGTGGGGNYGILIQNSSSNYVIGNNITTNGTGIDYGIYLLQNSDNNIITNNTILSTTGSTTSDAFFFGITSPDYPENNNLTSNTLLSISGNDIEYNTNFINGTWLIDQRIRAYDFDVTGSKINVKNSTFGQIEFLNASSTGANLIGNASADIIFGDNSVYVNATRSNGLNNTANATLFGIGNRGLTNLRIEHGGVTCDLTTLPSCFNYTALNAENVIFNVSGWIEIYSINGDAANTCTYTSGDWVVNPSDKCVITTNVNLGENTLICTGGTGYLDIRAVISNARNVFIHSGCNLLCYNKPNCFG